MRQLIRFHHWLLMACVVLALGVALSYSVRKLNKTAREHEGFLEKYDLLEEGMTEKEVAAILGPHTPDPLFEYPGGSLGEHNCFWYRGKDTIYVCFYSSVSGKRFRSCSPVADDGSGTPERPRGIETAVIYSTLVRV